MRARKIGLVVIAAVSGIAGFSERAKGDHRHHGHYGHRMGLSSMHAARYRAAYPPLPLSRIHAARCRASRHYGYLPSVYPVSYGAGFSAGYYGPRRHVVVQVPPVALPAVVVQEAPATQQAEPAYEVQEADWYQEKVAILLTTLGSSEKDIREKAAKELARFKSEQIVRALENVLVRDPEDDVREEAAESLGKIGDPSSLTALEQAMKDDSEESVRKEAKDAIERMIED